MIIKQKTMPALRSGDLNSNYNHAIPAYRTANIKSINLGKEQWDPKPVPPAARQAMTVQQMRSQPAVQSQPMQWSQPPIQPAAPAAPRTPPVQATAPAATRTPPAHQLPTPPLEREVQRGQKTTLNVDGIRKLRVCFGWQVNDGRVDADASVFAVDAGGKVPTEDWFVFYSQPKSPDGSILFSSNAGADRESVTLDLHRLDPRVKRLVFVLTINEAFENRLNFSMIRDAYVRVLDDATGKELISYRPQGFFEQVTSMTLCELYLHNGQWKFNPVGNGVHQDLAGQCAIYGVDIS